MKRRLLTLFLFIIVACLSGCAFFESTIHTTDGTTKNSVQTTTKENVVTNTKTNKSITAEGGSGNTTKKEETTNTISQGTSAIKPVSSTGDIDQYNNKDDYANDYGYKVLIADPSKGDAYKKLYENLDTLCSSFHDDYSSTGNATLNSVKYTIGKATYSTTELTSAQAANVYTVYKMDHPLYYWLSSSYVIGSVGTSAYIEIEVEPDYASAIDRKKANDKIYAKAQKYLEGTEGYTSFYQLALHFHDSIIDGMEYAYDSFGNPLDTADAHSIVGALIDGFGVCESYAETFSMLLNYSNIENSLVTGYAGEAHAWNIAKMDDSKYYWFDLTWDDQDYELGIVYNYFCSTDDTLSPRWDGGMSASSQTTFTSSHIPYTSSSTTFMYDLPARSTEEYSLDNKLRDTFTEGNNSYIIIGAEKVQITKTTVSGDFSVPEYVKHNGVFYDVVSIGGATGTTLEGAPDFLNVTSLTIPKSIKFIWQIDGSKLTSITVDKENDKFESKDGVLYTKGLYTLISYPSKSSQTSFTFSDTTRWIVDDAFKSLSYLTTVTLGKNTILHQFLLSVGYEFPRSVEDENTSKTASRMTSSIYGFKNLLNGAKTINYATDSTIYKVDDGIVYSNDYKIVYSYTQSKLEYVFNDQVETIWYAAFFANKAITKATFGTNLKEMKTQAFDACTNLNTINYKGTESQWASVIIDSRSQSVIASATKHYNYS